MSRPMRSKGLASHVLASIGRDILYGPWYDALFWLAFPALVALTVVTGLWGGAPDVLDAAEGVLGWLVAFSMIGWFGALLMRAWDRRSERAHQRRVELARAHGETDWAGYEQQVVGKLNALADLRATLVEQHASEAALEAVNRTYDQAVAEYKQRSESRSEA